MDYGMRVSKPGVDVKLAEDKDLIINSAYNSFKILKKGIEISSPLGNLQRVTFQNGGFAHSLGYSPSFMSFYKDLYYGGNQYWMPDGGGILQQQPTYDPSGSPTSGTFLNKDIRHRSWSTSTSIVAEIDNYNAGTITPSFCSFIVIEDNV